MLLIINMNPEYEKYHSHEKKGKDKTGFSEADLDRDVELQAGQWQNLKKFHAIKTKKDLKDSNQ